VCCKCGDEEKGERRRLSFPSGPLKQTALRILDQSTAAKLADEPSLYVLPTWNTCFRAVFAAAKRCWTHWYMGPGPGRSLLLHVTNPDDLRGRERI
jgi:hypothetical protein